jgi:hypothetical protein
MVAVSYSWKMEVTTGIIKGLRGRGKQDQGHYGLG